MIKEARVKKKILQRDFADTLGITGQFLGKIEKEGVGLPAVYFKKVAKTLGISLEKLIEWQTEKFRRELRAKIEKSK